MVWKVQRWSPDSCGCVVEQEVEYDDKTGEVITPPRFLLLNKVCDKHKSFASTRKKASHGKFSSRVINHIEVAKAANLKQVDDAIANATRILDKMDLQRARQQVIEFNNRLDIEWGELTSFSHAFDAHIHDQILDEQKELQARRAAAATTEAVEEATKEANG